MRNPISDKFYCRMHANTFKQRFAKLWSEIYTLTILSTIFDWEHILIIIFLIIMSHSTIVKLDFSDHQNKRKLAFKR